MSTPSRMDAALYTAVHGFNTALGIGFVFAQIFVFVRVLGPNEYATIILIAALAPFLSPIDSGFAKVVFSRIQGLRGRDAGASDRVAVDDVSITLVGYVGLLLLVTAVVATALSIDGRFSHEDSCRVGFLLFWLLTNVWAYQFQSASWAAGCHWTFEAIELSRRTLLFGLLLGLYWNGNFSLFITLANLVWLPCLALLAIALRRTGTIFANPALLRPARWATVDLRQLRASWSTASLASLGDVLLLNMPYLLIPFVQPGNYALIAYDLGRKIATASSSVMRIFTEGLLPSQAAAAARGDMPALRRIVATMFGLGLATVGSAAIVLHLGGPRLLALALGPQVIVPERQIVLFCGLMIAMCPYVLGSSVLLYSGQFRPMARISLAAAGAVVAVALLSHAFSASFEQFYLAYLSVIAVTAAAVAAAAWRQLLSPEEGRAAAAPERA